MNQEEYIKERLDDQINWYSGKSMSNQRKHKVWQVIKIIAALLVTTLSLLVNKYSAMVYVIGVMGAFIVFIESYITIYDFKKLWIQYRMASEKLKREKLLFQTASQPYAIEDPFQLLVQRCEAIMQNETQTWEDLFAEKDK
jgi:hypothetical protein